MSEWLYKKAEIGCGIIAPPSSYLPLPWIFYPWLYKTLKAFWTQKKIAVLGARGVGKTHLIQFLQTGTIPKQYKQTGGTIPYPEAKLSLDGLNLKITEGFDVSGDTSAYAEWEKIVEYADIVLYLVRADLLIQEDVLTIKRAESDIKHIKGWLDSQTSYHDALKKVGFLKNAPRFYILGTHCDQDSNFNKLTPSTEGNYQDKFMQIPAVKRLILQAGGLTKVKVIMGSMKTQEQTEELVYKLLQQENING